MNAEADPEPASWARSGDNMECVDRDGSTDDSREQQDARAGVGKLDHGAIVGRYEIRGELGSGGTGVVYLAQQLDLDRPVGLKALHRLHADATDFAERFARESRVTGSLSHPNIVTVYEYFVAHDTPFIAMEYVPGGSLRPWVGQLSLAQVVGVLEGLLAALAAVEPAGIVHRDLKPENLLVTADGRVKIVDFGIATASEGGRGAGEREGGSGATVGTPEYMAPEQALSRDIDGRADLYSVGIIAFEQLTGEVPFADVTDPIALLLRHVKDPIPSLACSRPDVDASLCEWVARLVARDPSERPPAAQQAWEELEELAIRLLGPVWRRDARLLGSAQIGASGPPEPRFQSRHIPVPVVPASSSLVEAPAGGLIPGRSGRLGLGRRFLVPAAFVASVLLGALLSLLLGAGRQATEGPEPFSTSALTAAFEIPLPAKWSAQGSIAPVFASLGPSSAVSLNSAAERGQLDVGISRTSSSTLLPPSLLAHLSHVPSGESIQLGNNNYYRYRSLEPKGLGLRANVYAQPTAAGVVLAVCVLPATFANGRGLSASVASASTVGVECEHILGSMRLRSARTLALGPLGAYARALAAALAYADAAQRSAGAQLRRATSAAAQAAAAVRLARAYEQASSMLEKVEAGPAEADVTLALKRAFSQAHVGYTTMAAAADADDASGFDLARSRVAEAQASMATSVEHLRGLGYRVGS